jgi:hypothetical protein
MHTCEYCGDRISDREDEDFCSPECEEAWDKDQFGPDGDENVVSFLQDLRKRYTK